MTDNKEKNDLLLKALETERRYIAAELHDSVAQTTQQLGLQISICRKMLERGKMEMLNHQLIELEARTHLASTQVREMIADMRPPRPDPTPDLEADLEKLIQIHQERNGPPVEYQNQWHGSPDLTSLQILALVRIVQESLFNIRKHSEADQARLILTEETDNFYIKISDNGKGFDPEELKSRQTDKGGAGLANMKTRAQALGGDLTLGMEDDKEWFVITITLPKE